MKKFYAVLANTLVANVTTSYIWFSLIFWLYLETKSLIVTSVIGGTYMLLVALMGMVFGTIVDKHHKKPVMMMASLITLTAFTTGGLLYWVNGPGAFQHLESPVLWLLVVVMLGGAVVENLRNVAMSTVVTILVPKKERARANGLVGTVQGVSFMVTSVLSGLSIGFLGIGWTISIAITLTALVALHLALTPIPEEKTVHDPELAHKRVDFKGSMAAIYAVPGLMALLIFSTFNNFFGGVYMALMDPYGLSLFPVQVWGILSGIAGLGFVVGGVIIGKFGLGKRPLRTMLIANIIGAIIGFLFTAREFAWLYVGGMFIYMCIMPIIEATEQTVIQNIVPQGKQGRVFGFRQTMSAAAMPISSFLIGPLAQYVIVPFMKSDGGRKLEWLVGAGQVRGIALTFMASSLILLIVAILAFHTRAYRLLSREVAEA